MRGECISGWASFCTSSTCQLSTKPSPHLLQTLHDEFKAPFYVITASPKKYTQTVCVCVPLLKREKAMPMVEGRAVGRFFLPLALFAKG